MEASHALMVVFAVPAASVATHVPTNAVEVFVCHIVPITALIASHVAQVRSVVSDLRGKYMAVFLREHVIESAWF